MVDGLFIRSLLLAFFFKMLPELIIQHKIYIAEPPLYRVDDKKDPFAKNMVDYNSRYIKLVSKDYKIGYVEGKNKLPEMLSRDVLMNFLNDTRHYEDDVTQIAAHYKCKDKSLNERLLEMILEEVIFAGYNPNMHAKEVLKRINIQSLCNRINETFKEIYYDDKDHTFKGVIDAQPQHLELSEAVIDDSYRVLGVLKDWAAPRNGSMVLKEIKTGNEHTVSLLETLKVLNKYKPKILHRFKGLNARPYNFNCRKVLVG